MLGMNDSVDRKAARYISDFGPNASNQISDDVNRAIGAGDLDAARELARVKFRVRRAELCDQIRERLELSRMRIMTG